MTKDFRDNFSIPVGIATDMQKQKNKKYGQPLAGTTKKKPYVSVIYYNQADKPNRVEKLNLQWE